MQRRLLTNASSLELTDSLFPQESKTRTIFLVSFLFLEEDTQMQHNAKPSILFEA